MRYLIRAFDGFLRWACGVFEFCDRPDCLIRLQWGQAAQDLPLSDGTRVQAGAPVLMLHIWNEHLPHSNPAGPDIAWAVQVHRMLVLSLKEVAQWLTTHPEGETIAAIGGITVLALADDGSISPLVRQLGFDVFPYRRALGRFGEFWENLYTWAVMWAFNVTGQRNPPLFRLRRAEIWMSRKAFLQRYGKPTSHSNASPSPRSR